MSRHTVESLVQRGLTKERAQALVQRQKVQADEAVADALEGYGAPREREAMCRALLASVVNALTEQSDALTASCTLSALSFRIAPGQRFRAVARAKADRLFVREEAA